MEMPHIYKYCRCHQEPVCLTENGFLYNIQYKYTKFMKKNYNYAFLHQITIVLSVTFLKNLGLIVIL